MLKAEAIQAMKDGKRVSHYLFGSDEWMTMEHGMIVFEDGVQCSFAEFFNKDRQGDAWEKDYKIVS
jgi:hypothetical protein